MKITTGKGQVEYYFVGFPKRRNYSRGSGDILHFPKIKVSSCLETIEQSIKTERFPKMSSLEGNECNMGEIMGNMTG